MTLVAGVDIGNSTTEIVIADLSFDPPRPIAWDRAPTRGIKGSGQAEHGAAALLTRMERRLGGRATRVLMTPQVPVLTRRIDIPSAAAELGPLTLLATGVATPAGWGHGVGKPQDASAGVPRSAVGPVVLVVRDPLGYRTTVDSLHEWRAAGHEVVAVVLAGDEATLVSARIGDAVPIVDSVDADAALACDVIAVEVAASGQHVRTLADPIWLASALGLSPAEHASALRAGALTYGHRSAAIGRRRDAVPSGPEPQQEASVLFRDGRIVPFRDALPHLAGSPVGITEQYRIPGSPPVAVDDMWIVDLDLLAELPGLRSGSVGERRLVVAALSPRASGEDQGAVFAEVWNGPVDVVGSESGASRAGAVTTPGLSEGAWVIDLGGGTVDAIGPGGESLTAAGCGELMTSAVAHALAISSGAAEWVKRGPASRVESPFVLADESGERRFVDQAAPHGTVGWLVTRGPSGSLPFSRTLALAEWRAMRMALKRQVFTANLARVLAGLTAVSPVRDVVVIGGPAGDEEILEALNSALGSAVVGRADVAATLGHRWAVAYGLVVGFGRG